MPELASPPLKFLRFALSSIDADYVKRVRSIKAKERAMTVPQSNLFSSSFPMAHT